MRQQSPCILSRLWTRQAILNLPYSVGTKHLSMPLRTETVNGGMQYSKLYAVVSYNGGFTFCACIIICLVCILRVFVVLCVHIVFFLLWMPDC